MCWVIFRWMFPFLLTEIMATQLVYTRTYQLITYVCTVHVQYNTVITITESWLIDLRIFKF